MKNIIVSIFAVFLGFIALIVISGLSALWSGYVLSVLWKWFMVGQFGLPALGVVSAAGVALVVRFMAHVPDAKKFVEENDKEFEFKSYFKIVAFAFIYPLLSLIFGWAIHLFL